MSADLYAGAAAGWAEGATLVYGPIARELVATIPHPVRGRTVLDVGAGTGAASEALISRGARVVALDRSPDMLRWRADSRPPAAVADVYRLPFARASVDDLIAAFLLNHLTEPATAMAELARVTRPHGAVVACVFSNASVSDVRDALDRAAQAEGWAVPGWYVELRATVLPVLGTVDAMAALARSVGLTAIRAAERAVDVGVTTAEQLVEYRLGQAQFVAWLRELGPRRTAEVKARLAAHIQPVMEPYQPVVIFLSALTPDRLAV
jgi:ubiquinone/menaquinone biosynthesis C-methylase UbiE